MITILTYTDLVIFKDYSTMNSVALENTELSNTDDFNILSFYLFIGGISQCSLHSKVLKKTT